MRYFWPNDRSPKAGYDTLLAVGADQDWGPVKVCVAKGGSVDLHVDSDIVSLRSAAGLFVTGEAIDWLPDFYVHELSVRLSTTAVTLKISGIEEQVYRETAPVSPVTEAVLSHLLRVLALPKLPPVWAHASASRASRCRRPAARRLARGRVRRQPARRVRRPDGLDGRRRRAHAHAPTRSRPRSRASAASPPACPGCASRSSSAAPATTSQTGEVQVGGLGQLENALVEALIRRSIPGGGDAGASSLRRARGAGALPGRRRGPPDPVQAPARQRPAAARTPAIRVRLDDSGLRIAAEPGARHRRARRHQLHLGGLRYSFDTARFLLDLEGDTASPSCIEGFVDQKAEKRAKRQAAAAAARRRCARRDIASAPTQAARQHRRLIQASPAAKSGGVSGPARRP